MTKPKAKRQNCINRLQDVAVERDSLPDVVKRLAKLEKINRNPKQDFTELQLRVGRLIGKTDDALWIITNLLRRIEILELKIRGDAA